MILPMISDRTTNQSNDVGGENCERQLIIIFSAGARRDLAEKQFSGSRVFVCKNR
jgi:hypothetical protein